MSSRKDLPLPVQLFDNQPINLSAAAKFQLDDQSRVALATTSATPPSIPQFPIGNHRSARPHQHARKRAL
jgi:hypothetical protein